jgi:magnesium transporter
MMPPEILEKDKPVTQSQSCELPTGARSTESGPSKLGYSIDVVAYGPEELIQRKIDKVEDLKDFLGKHGVLWVNVERMGDAKVVNDVGAIFGLHPLSLEDVINGRQRPKVEAYGNHHFIIARMPTSGENLETEQLSMFFTREFVITFQECPGDCLEPVRARVKETCDRSRRMGADYLAYTILDAVVDSYFPVLEDYGERLEDLEDKIVANPVRETISSLHDVKRDLLTLRRATWPLRDAVNTLLRDPLGIITQETGFYLRDCYDHLVQVIDLEENYRELASDLMDIYLSSISNKMNEVMKTLTIIATIFMPLTFIAGLYGMNFHTEVSPWNMPELTWYLGYPFALLLCAGSAIIMLIFFKVRKWF